MPQIGPITENPRPSRKRDNWGSGQFNAPRGDHQHRGLDIEAQVGEAILSPIDGEIVREATPYANDARYTGLLIRGTGVWQGCEVKMFYVQGSFTGSVRKGVVIGRAQNLRLKYPDITNHIHIRVELNGAVMNPMDLYGMSF